MRDCRRSRRGSRWSRCSTAAAPGLPSPRWDAALAMARSLLDATCGTILDEGRLVRLRSGAVQLRRHQATRNPPAKYQAFLAALAATANVKLPAVAAGLAAVSVYHRRRNNPGFAREMRLALETGYRRLEEALLESWMPEAHVGDGWRHNDPPPIPPMSAGEALHLLTLHRKTVEGLYDPLPKRRRENWDEWSLRAQLMAEQRMERQRELFRVAEAARRSRGEPTMNDMRITLPALDQVTGWSRTWSRTRQNPPGGGVRPFGVWDEDDG